MELRNLAERVLFSSSLEEKLAWPEALTDHTPGVAIEAPATPERPAELRFKATRGGPREFPGVHQLDNEGARGRVLHFFANHELLAAELMALVLLRFPNAPPAFRRAVAQTLRDEQEHTRLYIERMRACGVSFGEMPVSGFFWRAVAPMRDPVDYVAGLSLTFEQANLDFSRQFGAGFAAAGDALTASLLDRIYRDEIAHVATGLKWFRQWKTPGRDDWDAYCATVRFPLSPRRARGDTVNVEGRRAAGLDERFIAELGVHGASKGRTPSVFLFNPFEEGRIAMGPSFTPGKPQAGLARDLAALPMHLAREDDVVLVPERPSVEFLSRLRSAGFPIPEFVALLNGAVTGDSPLAGRKLGALRPWAWGPSAVVSLQPLFAAVRSEPQSPEAAFNSGIAELYSKTWSADFLRRFLAESREDGLCTSHDVGVAVSTPGEFESAVANFRADGPRRLVAKQHLGLAGANALRLWENEISAAQRRWVDNCLENGRKLVVEPWLDRLADFSAHWDMTPAGLKFAGCAGLQTDLRGQYEGSTAEPGFSKRVPSAVRRLFAGSMFAAQLTDIFARVAAMLEPALRQRGFRGPVGVDAFVFRDSTGAPRLKPIVEINPRCTMGRVAIELMRRVKPGSSVRFHLVSKRHATAAGYSSIAPFARHLEERNPLIMEGEPVAGIKSGTVCLTDAGRAETCVAILDVCDRGVGLQD
jgi:uncharacterized ferritin-like protein (DUF455 family)